jgi:hypothetical protein
VLVAAGVYVLGACFRYWPVAPWNDTAVLHHATNDPAQSVWYLAWMAHALSHGINPLSATAINVPHGANMAANTSTLALGVLAAPVTWLFGPVTSFNLLMRLGLAGSAFSMFLLLQRWVRWWPAAFLGGALYGFNAFTLRESVFHLHLEFLAVPPLIVWALDELVVSQRRRPLPTGVVLGLLAVVQWFINVEILVDCLLFAVLGLAILAIAHRGQVMDHLRRAAPGLVVGCAVFVIAIAYPLWFMLEGPQHLEGPTQPAAVLNGYHIDLLAPLVHGITLVTPVAGSVVGPMHLTPSRYTLNAGYLGPPLVAALIALTLWCWRRSGVVRFATVMGLCTFVLALGPRLTVLGHDTGVPLPAVVLRHVALLDELEPIRFTVLLWLFAAIVLGVGVDLVARGATAALSARAGDHVLRPADVGTGGSRLRLPTDGRVLLLPLVVVFTFVAFVPIANVVPPAVATPPVDALAAPAVARLTPVGGTVLLVPPVRRTEAQPMIWQARSGISYRIVGGYVIVPHSSSTSTNFPPPSPSLAKLYALARAKRNSRVERPDVLAETACRAVPTIVRHYDVDTIVMWHLAGAEAKVLRRVLRSALGPASFVSTTAPGMMIWVSVFRRLRAPAGCRILRSSRVTSARQRASRSAA